MTAIQIVLCAFAVFALSRVVMRFRKGGLPLIHLVIWFLFWAAVIVAVLRPATTSSVAAWVRVGRGTDLVMYLSVLALFYLLFRLFGKIEELERQITRVVRAAALKELDDKQVPPRPTPPRIPDAAKLPPPVKPAP
jgi:small membrane protein